VEIIFDKKIAAGYKSLSQKARVLTEDWVDKSVFCPNCGNLNIEKYPNNKPVADFFCSNCKERYELKSKQSGFGIKIVDGAYKTMIEQLHGSDNPNLFLLHYGLANYQVINFFVIPKHFFTPEIIEKRKPLSLTARRAGWTGCNILLQDIPQTGKIFFVKDKQIEPKERVIAEWKKTLFLREEKEVKAKSWLLDVMVCLDKLGYNNFTLDQVYAFENELSKKHPDNRHIKDKIRQQLQVLRDRGYLEFTNRGNYRLI